MEVASPRRAALRLAALAIVVAAPVVLLSVAAYRATAPAPTQSQLTATATSAADSAPAWSMATPATKPIEPDAVPLRVAQVEPRAVPQPESITPPPRPEGVIVIDEVPTPRFAGYRPPGAVVVQNPAAMIPAADVDATAIPTHTPAPAEVTPQAFEAVIESIPAPPSQASASPRSTPVTYTASTSELSRRLEPEVQDGFRLGRAGAVYAARARFVRVLRQIARAKDAEQGGTRYSAALAEGLRAMDDADDFVARGDALEAELDVAAIARSHTVDLVASESQFAPHEAIEVYSNHAAARLAEAVSGEPAGSMALYGLGKTYARLETQSDDPTAGRKSAVMYRAAVDAQPTNYLAANELGVRLASIGRFDQASQVLRTAARQPGSIAMVHANLAAIENRLGRGAQAVEAQRASQRLATQERARGDVSRRMGVQWVDPQAFARTGSAQPNTSVGAGPEPTPTVAAPTEDAAGGWTGFVKAAKRVTGWSEAEPSQAAAPRAPVVTPRVLR